MPHREWSSFSLPPVKLTLDELEELVATAGADARLTADGAQELGVDELISSGEQRATRAVITSPELRLEFADDHATLLFNNEPTRHAESIVWMLSRTPPRSLFTAFPLLAGGLAMLSMLLIGFRIELVLIATVASIFTTLVGALLWARRWEPISEPVAGDPDRCRTTFSYEPLTMAELGELVAAVGKSAKLALPLGPQGPAIAIESDGLTLTLSQTLGELVYSANTARIEKLADQVQCYRRRLRWFTHDDLAIFAGMLLPLGAALVVPSASRDAAALIAVLPWLIYLLWVLQNRERRWCVITRSNADTAMRE